MTDRTVARSAAAAALIAGVGVFALIRATRPPVGNPRVPQPAKPVELERYLGLWYEIARYDVSFERNGEGVTAEYTLLPSGEVGVLNTEHLFTPNGRVRSARARARVVPGSGNAKLKVAFFGPFFVGNYWVMDRADDYTWSIVGEPSGRYLWLLARDPVLAEADRDALVARAASLGYDTSMLRFTRQPPG